MRSFLAKVKKVVQLRKMLDLRVRISKNPLVETPHGLNIHKRKFISQFLSKRILIASLAHPKKLYERLHKNLEEMWQSEEKDSMRVSNVIGIPEGVGRLT